MEVWTFGVAVVDTLQFLEAISSNLSLSQCFIVPDRHIDLLLHVLDFFLKFLYPTHLELDHLFTLMEVGNQLALFLLELADLVLLLEDLICHFFSNLCLSLF